MYSQHDGGTPENVVINDAGGRYGLWNLLQVNYCFVPSQLNISGGGERDHTATACPPEFPFCECWKILETESQKDQKILFRQFNILENRALWR